MKMVDSSRLESIMEGKLRTLVTSHPQLETESNERVIRTPKKVMTHRLRASDLHGPESQAENDAIHSM